MTNQAQLDNNIYSPEGLGQSGPMTTWFERLILNLASYLIIILPIAFIVIAAKNKFLPRLIQTNALIQKFVFGSSTETSLQATLHDRNVRAQRYQSSDKKLKSNALEFILCLLGLHFSYLIWGLLQEKIMTTKYPVSAQFDAKDLKNQPPKLNTNTVSFHDSQFLVFINRLVAFVTAILALVFVHIRQKQSRTFNGVLKPILNVQKPQAPLYKYIYCSLSNILSSWSQYEALKYVNFPTQCLSKSCKVIPVMLMSRILVRQRHPPGDYVCAVLLALGMFIFMFNQPMTSKLKDRQEISSTNTLWSGLIILSLYLTFDSFTSNWQQSLYSQYDISNWQMMAAINFYSILLTITSLHQLGSLRPALQMLASSSPLMQDCLMMSFMSSIGQMFVYYTIKRFGSVLFAVIMTLRQFLSILISIVVFNHEISLESTSGLIIVFLVAGYQIYHKSKKRIGGAGGGSKESLSLNQSLLKENVLIDIKN